MCRGAESSYGRKASSANNGIGGQIVKSDRAQEATEDGEQKQRARPRFLMQVRMSKGRMQSPGCEVPGLKVPACGGVSRFESRSGDA